jgi:hypothetical protein
LLVRVLLVLAGAVVTTGIGWLLSTASASADVLPTVPVPPLSSVTDAIVVPAVPTAPALPSTLSAPALPSSPADLDQVTQQVHLAVSGVGDRVPPATAPVAGIVPLAGVVSTPDLRPLTATAPKSTPSIVVPPVPVRPAIVVVHRHSVTPETVRPTGGTGMAPADNQRRRLPVLPPLQPAGSSDANVHGSGGSTGGAGGTQLPFVTLLGAAPHSIGMPMTPRLPVAPGQQPGTSPD